MGTVEGLFLMLKFYCTHISGTNSVFRRKQKAKGFVKSGLEFDHQTDQFAFMEPIILNVRNVALNVPFFFYIKTLKQKVRLSNNLIELKQLVKPHLFSHAHTDTKAVDFLEDSQECIHTGRSVPVHQGCGDVCKNVHVLAHKMSWIWFHAKVNSPPAEVLADMDDMHHTSFLLSAELVLLLTNQSFPDRSIQKEKLWLHHFVTFGFYFFFL